MIERIEYTLLLPTMTESDVARLCETCKEQGYRSVCIPPAFIQFARTFDVKITSTVGYPYGYDSFYKKMFDLTNADEYDITMNVGLFKAGYYLRTLKELTKLITSTSGSVRVDVRSSDLTQIELLAACQVVEDSEADCIILNPESWPISCNLKTKVTPISGSLVLFSKADIIGVNYESS